MSQEHHRPSALKQRNKKHNILGHRTKGQVEALSKGRISVKDITKKIKHELNREQKKVRANQIRKHKKDLILSKKRQLGSSQSPPFLVTILPLSEKINPRIILNALCSCDSSATSSTSSQGILHISSGRFKQRFSFVVPPLNDIIAILDAAKVSDTILFAWDAEEEITDATKLILASLAAQGMPTHIHTVVGLEELAQKRKQRGLKILQKEIGCHFPGHLKLHSFEHMADVLLLLRQIGCQKQKSIFYRDNRTHMIAEKVVFQEEDGTSGSLKIYGYIRHQPLSVNSLVHIPGWGDYQMSHIESCTDPHPLQFGRKKATNEMLEDEIKTLALPDPDLQESLQDTNEIDPMEGEQTWPTEEELKKADKERFAPKHKIKKVPKGTSDYQATWLVDSEDDSFDDEESMILDMDDAGRVIKPTKAPSTVAGGEDEEACESNKDMTEVDNDEYDKNMDYESEKEEHQTVHDDLIYPDQIETPEDEHARSRFQKYRGLESFRTSTWDPKENLPLEYSQIFQFKNYDHIRKRMFKAETKGIEPGQYVIVTLKDVPHHLFQECIQSQSPLALFGILPHEHKMSVLNVVMRSNVLGHSEAIKSKERLIFHVGFRRFANCPVFSEHSTGNKHKYARFFHPGDTVIASMFAPIVFSPCPVIVFKVRSDGTQDLVSTGSVFTVNPDRIVCKRVILSGMPFKINSRNAVIRYMFCNREDILWFRPIKLRTRTGLMGHIKQALGTHGHMRCVFNGSLPSHDTIFLNLYKRMFPKWTFDPYVPRGLSLSDFKIDPVKICDDEESVETQVAKKVRFLE